METYDYDANLVIPECFDFDQVIKHEDSAKNQSSELEEVKQPDLIICPNPRCAFVANINKVRSLAVHDGWLADFHS